MLTALESAVTLPDLKPARLAIGHGRVFERPAATIDVASKEAEEKVYV